MGSKSARMKLTGNQESEISAIMQAYRLHAFFRT